MSFESQLSKHPDSVEGKDYIVDHYGALGLTPDADEEAIRSAFLAGIRQYHPDVVSRAAPDIQLHAAHRTQVLVKARDILLDPEQKELFDTTLSEWGDKPVSSDGTKLLIISRRGMLQDAQTLSDALSRARSGSGFDTTMFNFIEEQFETSETPTENLKDAYREGLRRKDVFLGAQEHLLSESAGIATPTNAPEVAYQLAAENRVATRRTQVDAEVEEAFMMLEQGLVPMLGAGSEQVMDMVGTDANQALDMYREESLKKFDATAEQILALAGERQEVIAKRLSLLRINYVGQQDRLFERIIIGIRSEGETVWLPFTLNEGSIDIDIAVLSEYLSDLDQPDKANERYLLGQNIILTDYEDNLPILESASEAAFRHYEQLFKQNDITMVRGDTTIIE